MAGAELMLSAKAPPYPSRAYPNERNSGCAASCAWTGAARTVAATRMTAIRICASMQSCSPLQSMKVRTASRTAHGRPHQVRANVVRPPICMVGANHGRCPEPLLNNPEGRTRPHGRPRDREANQVKARQKSHHRNGRSALAVRRALKAQARPDRVAGAMRFFKCGPGEYGEGDVFIAVSVPAQRAIARQFGDLPLEEVDTLLRSRIHEERLTELLILVHQFTRGD